MQKHGQRLLALFFVCVMVSSFILQAADVYALATQNGSQDLMGKVSSAPQPTIKSKNSAAADYVASGKAPLAGDAVNNTTGPGQNKKNNTYTPHELVDKRTTTSTTSLNKDGSFTQRNYTSPHFYKSGNSLVPIDTSLVEDKNAADSGSILGKTLGSLESLANGKPSNFIESKNDWLARFSPSDFSKGMVRIQLGNDQVGYVPQNANTVTPVITTNNGQQTVNYYNLWNGVDVAYQVLSDRVKESIILKNKDATNQVSFKVIGATPKANADGSFTLSGALQDQFSIAPPNLILNNFGYVDPAGKYSQVYDKGLVTTSVDVSYLNSLPTKAFPAVIDPSTFRSPFGTRASGNYISFKSDGYVCYYNVCNLYAGSLYDSNWNLRWWRGAFFSPYDYLRQSGTVLQNVNLHLTQLASSYWTGTWDAHNFQIGHATCLNNFNCVDGVWDSATFGGVGDINVTNLYQYLVSVGDFGGWLMLMGEDGSDSSFKNFDPDNSWVDFTFNRIPPTPTITTPSVDNQTFVDPQVGFQVAPVSDGDGDPVQYYFRIASSPDGETGTVINSGNLSSTQWTVPDGVLQDGTTYYLHAYTYDGNNYSTASAVRPFKIDSRRGKDKTQTYDTLGPVTVDLATGNLSTSESSHTSAALAGSLGVSLDYNSPLRSRQGLVGEYWNVPTNYYGPAPGSQASVTRVDKNIDFDWNMGSPSSGTINNDWFYTRWTGYFVAPTTGSYYFGGNNDDSLSVWVNNQQVYSQNCFSGVCYNAPVTLTAGQVVPLRVEYVEATWTAYAHLYVRGVVAEQVVPQAWLQTGARSVGQQYGLTGHYYTDDGSHNLDSATKTQFLSRLDPTISFNWGTGSPVPNGPTDNFMVRWNGYVAVPVSGTYRFGTFSDDGSRVTIGTTQVMSQWGDSAGSDIYGTPVSLTAGQAVPIVADFYEHGGGAQMFLKVIDANGVAQVVPSTWLSPNAQVLPTGWNLGIDPDGNLNYDHLSANQSAVILTDSTGDTHQYTWTGSDYKPPVNEDGHLVRNANGTFTLTDVDGRTYIFGTDGILQSVTNPVDDRSPAALRYSYSGSPAKINKITDGVDPGRYAAVYYSGDSNCGSAPSGFDGAAPAGMLCGVATNDGRTTYFYYLQGSLARIVKPGNDTTDYQYDTLGRIVGLRDSVANDAVNGGIRANDTTTYTQISYDNLGRVANVTEPAPSTGASPIQNTIEYLPGNGDGTGGTNLGITRQHVVGASEPNGFTRQISYDNLLRTTSDTDIANLTTAQKWNPVKDLLYSTTDASGLTSSTIYDSDDRPVQQYGPAPSSWFNSDGTPQSSYGSQIPRTDIAYDEGIVGPSVAWYNYQSAAGGTLLGAPKLHTTGFSGSNDAGWLGHDFRTTPVPITPDSGMDGYGFSATGKIKFPTTGTYTFNLWNDDGARLSVDDTQVLSNWGTVTEGIAQNRQTGTFSAVAGQIYRFRLDYEHIGNPGALELWLTGSGIADTGAPGLGTSHLGSYLVPDYSLATSATTSDSTVGNSKTTTSHGSSPELGLAQNTSLDPSGLNLTSTATYEPQGAVGGFLRQLSKTLPGGATTNYSYFSATETADNPCTSSVEAHHEGGLVKLKTEPDPDGTGPLTGRTTQTVYDDAGRVVATRYNSDPWTCTSYDSRGRTLTTTIPALNGQAARAITNNYAVGGNPLMVSSMDASGTITTQTDLLGRTVSYTDTLGYTTNSTYDNSGHLTGRTGPLGAEAFVYDTYDRLTDQKLDGVIYAHINYDQYSRISTVAYPDAGQEQVAYGRDALGRLSGLSYTSGTGTAQIADNVNISQSGQVVSGTENSLSKNYSYDTTGRLTGAIIGGNTFGYDYSAPSSATCAQPSANLNANKDSNRTKLTINGATTTYCYDQADRLIASSDTKVSTPTYDAHGNTTQLGSGTSATQFTYDSSDRNSKIVNGKQSSAYARDVQDRVIKRIWTRPVTVNGVTNQKTDQDRYVFTGAGDAPDMLVDGKNALIEKYMTLPGDVLLTIQPSNPTTLNRKVYSLPNIHGDIFATTNQQGSLLTTTVTGPYGEPIAGQKNPNNTAAGTTYDYVGKNQKMTETKYPLNITQMGARVYIPTLGRFLQVDPKEGGTPNNYVYPPDPVNDFDLTGDFGWKAFATIASIGSFIPGPIGMISSGAAAIAYAAAGDKKTALMMAAGIALGGAGAIKAFKAVKDVKAAATVARLGHLSNIATHGNSLSNMRATVGYKLYSSSGQFLKNGITSRIIPESRYTKAFMSDKYMVTKRFPNRKAAYNWEARQNRIRRGSLNYNWH